MRALYIATYIWEALDSLASPDTAVGGYASRGKETNGSYLDGAL